MQRKAHLTLLILTTPLLLALAGCEPIQSVHPFWTKETLVFEPALLGTWAYREKPGDPGMILRFEDAGENEYRVSLYAQKPPKEENWLKGWALVLQGRLVRLDGAPYLDLYPEEVTFKGEKRMDVGNTLFHLGVHSLFRVEIQGGTLKLAWLDDEGVAQTAASKRINLGHIVGGGLKVPLLLAVSLKLPEEVWLLTASTAELQQFVAAHANDEALFATPMEFKREKGGR